MKHFEEFPFLSAYVPAQNAKRRFLRSSCFRCRDLCEYASPISALEPVQRYSQNLSTKMMKLEDIPKLSFAHFFPLTLDTWVRFQISQLWICHGHKSFGTGLFFRGHRFYPAIIVPPLLHTHSFNYHRRSIILATDRVFK